MTKKKVAIVGTAGVPACYGGFETLVENLLPISEQNVTIYCSGNVYPKKISKYKEANLVYIPFDANGVWSVIYDGISLVHSAIKRSDVILVLGVSGCIFFPVIKLFSKAKVVTNIDGLEWRRDKWSGLAKKFLKFSESIAVQYSDVIISDNQAIADYLMQEYSSSSAVIAYGGDHATIGVINKSDGGYALSVCRIEPENNVHVILDAFSKSDYHLKFIGNWNNSHYGRELKDRYNKYPNLELIDSIYDKDELAFYRANCRYYVHGHSAGGTNPSLVEIMHFAKPVIAFDCAYNRATTENCASFFSDVDSLVRLIERFFTSIELESDNAKAMYEIANKKYTWVSIKEKYFNVLFS